MNPGKAIIVPRLQSLDALRGFDMIWIIGFGSVIQAMAKFIGTPSLIALVDRQLEHGPWVPPDYGRWAQGVTLWDLIMPLFLFCTGSSMPFSMDKRRSMGDSTAKIYTHIFIRVVLLWILGLMAQGHLLAFDLSKLHLYCNTLQAIAAGYLIAAVIYLHFSWRGQIFLTAFLLLFYWVLLAFIPVPGGSNAEILPNQNIADWIDRILLGHFDDGVPYTWILSSIGFGASVMLGVFAGTWLQTSRPQKDKAAGLFIGGTLLVLAGFFWSGWSPIIKYIWTSSMTLYWGGWSLLLLGVFYLFIDVLGWHKIAFPFMIVGRNAIAAYMIAHLFNLPAIVSSLVGGLKHLFPAAYPLILAATAFLFLWLILLWMYRTRTFVKI